ncbi:hypothetical protein ACLQ29_31485 [Micromonospora sp. DT228]|uniref:hypothetical protein n=1 Tax=Micromonospora sp. DT228 TaxID=3393443 RepID=UPI003CE6AABA
MIGLAAEPTMRTRYADTLIDLARQQHEALVKAVILLLTAAVEATGANDQDLPERLAGSVTPT